MNGTLASLSGGSLSISSSKFSDFYALKDIIEGIEGTILQVTDSSFENFSSRSVAKLEDSHVTSSNTIFKANNTQRELNGTRYTRAFEAYSSFLTLEGNTFENLASDIGGAIYIRNSNGSIAGNTFARNTATKGGSIAFSCGMEYMSEVSLDRNTFVNNVAQEGGAIHYDLFRPAIGTTNIFTNNTAEYGTEYASYPAYLEYPDASYLTGIASGQQI